MKVPSPVVGSVRLVNRASGYISVPNATPAAFGAGVGQALEQMGAVLKTREDQTARFGTMTAFEEFQSNVDKGLVELQRNAPPDGKNFTQQAEEYYTAQAEAFKSQHVAQDQADEYDYRLEQYKRGVIGRSMDFQYKAGDAYFRKGVNDIYQRSLGALDPSTGGDPTRLESERAKAWAAVDATDLSDIEKDELKRNISRGLEGVTYKQLYKSKVANESAGTGGAASILRKEEGFRETPYWDVNAYRVGYGSDTVTRADGTVVKVTPGMRITRDDAERDLARRAKEFEGTARDQVGPQAWGALSGNARAALTSVAYNYGSLPNSVVQAVKSGNVASIAVAVENLSANKSRRAREAAIIRGGGEPTVADLDSNPAFGELTYEDRLAAQRDAETEFNREASAAAAQRKLEIDTQINDLMNGIMNGSRGQADIDRAYEEGWLGDYDARKKAQDAYDKYAGEAQAAVRGAQKLTDPYGVFDPADAKDRDALNAVVKAGGGMDKIREMDSNYVSNGIVPMVQKAGDIPTDVAGLLTGMARSRNMSQMLFAMESLRMLQDAAPDGFNARVGDDLAKKVEYYRARKDLYTPQQLMDMVNGGQSQEVRQNRLVLESEAKEHLAKKTEGVSKLAEVVAEVTGEFGGWFSSPSRIALPEYARAMDKDYQTFFTDAYTHGLSVEEADVAARKELKKYWAVTEIGGERTVMKYPPEQMGYKKIAGSYDWIASQVRAEHGLKPEDKFQLISDEQTWKEFNNFRNNVPDKEGNVRLPSYQVVVFGEDGPRLSNVGRSYFQPTVEDRLNDERDFTKKLIERDLLEAESRLMEAQNFYSRRGEPVPPEFQEERDRLMNLYNPTVPEPPARPQAETMSEGVEPMVIP